jgi:hypothetical protein
MAGPTAKLLWMHNCLGYIYESRGVTPESRIEVGILPPKRKKI